MRYIVSLNGFRFAFHQVLAYNSSQFVIGALVYDIRAERV